ncbi:MAG: putative glycoside hydrolase family 15 protein [Actinomycetota bacterium]|nr:putative glycoside hydrolase family 15 protein [Actinomycetota bacterium]
MSSIRVRRRGPSAFVASLGVLAAGLGSALVAPVHPASAAPGPSVFHTYGPQYMSRIWSVTKDQAIADAREFGVIAAKPDIYAAYLPAMKAANPSLVVVAYMNASMARPTEGSTYPAGWYVRDASGVQVRSKYSNYMMDVRKPGWILNRTNECKRILVTSGYDGCMLDIMGPGVVNGPFGPTGQVDRQPVDARTGQNWTFSDWMAGTTHLADVMQTSVAPRLVYGNGVSDGVRYFGTTAMDGTDQLLTPARSVIAEGFLRSGRAPIGSVPDLPTWQANVAMVKDAEARGVELLLTTKAWTVASQQQKDQVHEFSLGTYLLAAGGRTRWVFLYDEAGDTMVYHPWWTEAAALGGPRGDDFVNPTGLYQRNFVGGRVLVNPGRTTVSQGLGRAFVTLDGATVTRVTLPPHSARVLRSS